MRYRSCRLIAGSIFCTCMSLTPAYSQSETTSHTYDELGRLVVTEVTSGPNDNDVRQICYDETGNRTELINRADGTTAACAYTSSSPAPPTSPSDPPPPPADPPQNYPPHAGNETVSGECGTATFIDLTSVASDPDGDPLTFTSLDQNSGNASASLNANGTGQVTFGTQSDISTFIYTVEDPSGASDSATLYVLANTCSGGGPAPD